MAKHLVEDVTQAVDDYYGDMSRTKEETLKGLQEILEHTYELEQMLDGEINALL